MPLTRKFCLERVEEALGDQGSDSKIAQDQSPSRLHPAIAGGLQHVARHAQSGLRSDDGPVRRGLFRLQGWCLEGRRFAVVVQLLSVQRNHRLRVRTFCADDDLPIVSSLMDIWPGVNWFEREAFDMFGIVFEGIRICVGILTDMVSSATRFRKDFPISGHVEMRYDPELKRWCISR